MKPLHILGVLLLSLVGGYVGALIGSPAPQVAAQPLSLLLRLRARELLPCRFVMSSTKVTAFSGQAWAFSVKIRFKT